MLEINVKGHLNTPLTFKEFICYILSKRGLKGVTNPPFPLTLLNMYIVLINLKTLRKDIVHEYVGDQKKEDLIAP